MQRMLVGLIVVLTAAVGALAVATINLYLDDTGAEPRRQAAPSRTPGEVAVDPRRLSVLEERLASLRDENEGFRTRQKELERLVARLREAPPPQGGSTDGSGGGPAPSGWNTYPPGEERPRAADGGFVITEEDEAYFEEVQRRIQERRRVDNLARGAMARIERLARTGEIAAVPEESRDKVEGIVKKYVQASDSIVRQYFRNTDDEVRKLTSDQKRELVQDKREVLRADLQRDLEPVLGAADASRAAESVLASSFGLRNARERRFQPPGRQR